MSVSGNQLLRNGQPFTVHGFTLIGALSPPGCHKRQGIVARQHYGQAELTAYISRWHANTVRFQVSQPGLATNNRARLAAYLRQLKSQIGLALSNHLVVILSMQDESVGCGPASPMPTAQTVTAWRTLAPLFANNPYVMFELYNEPQSGLTAADWSQWRNGGSSPISTAAVGQQQLLDDVRRMGANNVVLVDGAKYAEHFDGAGPYLLTDTASGHGVVYAVHPFYYAPGPRRWQNAFGWLTRRHPVLVTAWDYLPESCGTRAETVAPAFLAWLKAHKIGMTVFAGDRPGKTMADWSYTPTQCGTAVGGNGALTQAWFSNH